MKKREFIFFGVVMTISIAFFITASIMKDAKCYFTIDELVAHKDAYKGLCYEDLPEEAIQVDGFVKVDSIRWNNPEHLLVFQLTDRGDKKSIKVFYKNGIIPNNFQEGRGVVVEGVYD